MGELLKEILMNDNIMQALLMIIFYFLVWYESPIIINESRYRFRRLTQKEIDEEYKKDNI